MPAWYSEEFRPYRYRPERVRVRELMDDPALEAGERERVLKGIETISHWPGQRMPLLRAILRLLGHPSRKFKLIEVGAGNGHLSRWISAELARRGYDIEVIPSDLFFSPGVEVLDCSAESLPQADIYFSTLLLHHLGDWQACQMMLAQSKAARLGFLHFEMQRHFFHFHAARLCMAVARLHPINRIDGLLSIQQAYTRPEIKTFATATGLDIDLSWHAPFRWLLTWRR